MGTGKQLFSVGMGRERKGMIVVSSVDGNGGTKSSRLARTPSGSRTP